MTLTRADTKLERDTILSIFKDRVYKTVVIVAHDSLIDQAVQLAISVKNEQQHGLHQVTKMSLVQNSQELTKQIFSHIKSQEPLTPW